MNHENNVVVINQIQSIRQMVNNPNAPGVTLLMDNMSDEDVARLYSTMDFIVNPSRGEGLCLPLVQGMSAGCIPISNRFSAPGDYVRPLYSYVGTMSEPELILGRDLEEGANGFLVNYTLEPAIHMPRNPWYRFDQMWGRVDLQDLISAIRAAVVLRNEHPLYFSKMRANARATIVNTMSPAKFAEQAVASLEEVLGGCKV
jgi:glycosyltransferase involved in cell wall biosynthesis